MKVARRFTRRGHSPYGDLSFEPRVSEIRNPDGKVIFRQEGVIVPSTWSQIATDILAQKYFRKTGVPQEKGGTGGEHDARQVFHRLAFTWMDWGRRHRYFDGEEDAQAFYDELCHMLAHQMAAPNSPQWFNTGLYAVYGIQGPPQGHYYADPETGEVRRSENAYERPQPHACQPYHATVSTPTGPVPIGTIVEMGLVGLEVYDGTDGGRGTTRVVAVAENGVKPVFRVVLKNGSTLEATGDHLVLASEQRRGDARWMRVDELEPGLRLRQSTVSEVKLAVACSDRFPGKEVPALREEAVVRLEFAGLQPVYDIQTGSGQYLSNNIVVHNCFILSVEDDLVNEGGIMDLVTSEARLFKYGSGTGSNFSRLRGRGEPLSGGGISSGLLSFLKVADRSASAIKSGGTTRRAAKMVTLDADHPDIEEYVRWKVNEEQKVAAMAAGSRVLRRAADRLLAACAADGASAAASMEERTDPTRNPVLGQAVRESLEQGVPLPFLYKVLQLARQGFTRIELPEIGTEWDEDGYNTVSGQSSNNSVRLSAAFMQAVLEDGDWKLAGRIDGRVDRAVKARWLWDLIAYAAWSCADPGIQYHSTINEWHTCSADGEIRASNPCSEYMFLDDTACNLASLNLLRFYDPERRRFRLEDLRHAVNLWTIVLEISVLMAQFPGARIARRSYDYRTLGLGYANLGSLLMVMGLPYDSEAGRAVAGALSAILTGQAYATSALLARELGPFARFAANREPMLRVIRNHRRAAWAAAAGEYEGLSVLPRALDPAHCPPELLESAREVWDLALRLGEAHGYRNAQVSAIAPTGTIGLLMDCDTTGVEPDYALVKFKKLAGGGFFKIINSSIPPALRNLGYTRGADPGDHRVVRGAAYPARRPAPVAGGAGAARLPGGGPDPAGDRRARRLPAAAAVLLRLPGQGGAHRGPGHPGRGGRPAGLRPAGPPRVHPRAGGGGGTLRLRGDEPGGRPAPEGGALARLRHRQPHRPPRPALHRLAGPRGDDGRRAAVHQRGRVQDDQHARHRHGGGREGGAPALLAEDAQIHRPLPRRLQAQPAAERPVRRGGGPGAGAAEPGPPGGAGRGRLPGPRRAPPGRRRAAASCPTGGAATPRR